MFSTAKLNFRINCIYLHLHFFFSSCRRAWNLSWQKCLSPDEAVALHMCAWDAATWGWLMERPGGSAENETEAQWQSSQGPVAHSTASPSTPSPPPTRCSSYRGWSLSWRILCGEIIAKSWKSDFFLVVWWGVQLVFRVSVRIMWHQDPYRINHHSEYPAQLASRISRACFQTLF